MIPLLAESEKGRGQTESITKDDKRCGEHEGLSRRFKFAGKQDLRG